MNRKALKTIFAAVLCLGVMATPALAQMSISIDIGRAPPPPRHEEVHVAPHGYFWLPGYWLWDGGRHQWNEGRMERSRPGQHWRQAQWEDRGQVHHFEPGRWERDQKQYKGKSKYKKESTAGAMAGGTATVIATIPVVAMAEATNQV
ncbi:MAG: YXWGXW repeat-containing protein [Proteobacteria bacterium]|nr:YXWGXW repeat-containing protein [Pseudomonadota bacterium]